MDDWNEPRLVLAVKRAGSLTGAARTLGIETTPPRSGA
jgi:hypothetical protein